MVLELPELTQENQDWKIYHAHILDSTATEGVVSHLTGAAPKPVDSCELEAWKVSNAVAKYIILEVITDSLLVQLMHHELAHTLFSHLAAIFGDLEPLNLQWNRAAKTSLSVRTHTQSQMALTQRTPQKSSKEYMSKEPAQPQKSQTPRHMHLMDCQVKTGARRQSTVEGSTLHTTQIVIMTIVVYHSSSK